MLTRLDRLLCAVETTMMVGLTLLGLFLGVLQVILRYVFNTGIHWIEGLLVISLVWAALFGASRAIRQGYHPRVDLLPLAAPRRVRAVLNLLALGITLALCAFYLADSLFFASFVASIGVINRETGLPEVYFFAIIPIAMLLFCTRYLLILIALRKEVGAETPEEVFRNSVSLRPEAGE